MLVSAATLVDLEGVGGLLHGNQPFQPGMSRSQSTMIVGGLRKLVVREMQLKRMHDVLDRKCQLALDLQIAISWPRSRNKKSPMECALSTLGSSFWRMFVWHL